MTTDRDIFNKDATTFNHLTTTNHQTNIDCAYLPHSEKSCDLSSATTGIEFSTAYTGPKITRISTNFTIPRRYLPHESTAFTGNRGGYLYNGELLYYHRRISGDIYVHNQESPENLRQVSSPPKINHDLTFLQKDHTSRRYPPSKFIPQMTIIIVIPLLLSLSSYWLFFRDNAHDKPADIVQAYFLALAENRAMDALQLSRKQLSDTRFLSPDILRLQNSLAALQLQEISNTQFFGSDQVTVQFKLLLGKEILDGAITLERFHGRWYLSTPGIPIGRENIIHSTDDFGPELLSIDGKNLSDITDKTYFFPGMHAISLNDSHTKALILHESHFILQPNFFGMKFPQIGMHIARDPLSGQVTMSVMQHTKNAVMQTFTHCSRSKIFQRMHCPFPLPSQISPSYTKKSIHWGLPLMRNDQRLALHYNYGPISDEHFISYIQVRGAVKLPWTIPDPSGLTAKSEGGNILMQVHGKVNILGANKYVFSFN